MSTYPTDVSELLNLDPATGQTLQAFSQRRRILLAVRGVAAAIVVFVALMLVVAACDYLFLLPDSLRWSLSLTGYVAAVVAFWWFGLRLIRDRDPRHLARRIEAAEPVLREDLLSAVELADPEDANGSPTFQQRLQGRVARRVSKVNVSRLLPIGLVRRPLSTGLVVVAVCLACLLFPSLQFGRRLARAMLPGVPIERASRTVVTIIEPNPASGYVAEGDAVAIIVDISGEGADVVTLHWRTEDGISGEAEMTPRVVPPTSGSSQEDTSVVSSSESPQSQSFQVGETFAANLSVGSVPVEYRITAGDAITLWHELTPLPRPRVKLFTKRYEFPSYAKLNDRVEEDEYGDLKALMGTTAHLTILFDEPVEDAAIRFANQGPEMRLEQADDSETSYSVSIPIKTAGQYQVDATSVRSGLNNPFSPTYTITPVIDSPPVARWASSVPQVRLVSPLDVVSLEGIVRDDLPVDDVIQEFQINDQPFQSRSIELAQPGRELSPAWEWDLMHRGSDAEATPKLSPGDIVQMRLVAIDRNGTRGESRLIDLLVADDGFDADRHARIAELAEIAGKLIAWSDQAKELADSVKSIAHSPKGVDLAETRTALDELAELTPETMEAVMGGLELASNVHEAGLLELLGRAVLDIDRRSKMSIELLSHVLGDDHDSWRKTREKVLRDLQSSARRSSQQCDRLTEVARAMIGQQLSVAVLNDAMSLKNSLAPLLSEDDPLPASRFPRYLTVVRGRLASIDQVIETYSELIPSSTKAHFQSENWIRWSQRKDVQLEKAIDDPPGEQNYRALVRSFDSELTGKIGYALNDGRLPGMLTNTPRDLRNDLGMVADWIRYALLSATEADKIRSKKENESDSKELSGLNRAEKYHDANFARFIAAILDKASSEETLHRSRPNVDLQYAADLGLLSRAVENVTREGFKPYRDEPAPQVFNNLTRAIQILEAAHEANLWQKEVNALLSAERRIRDIGVAKLQHPLWLERFAVGMEWPWATLRNLNLPWEITQPLNDARSNQDFALARERVGNHRWDREPLTAELAVEKVNANMNHALQVLDPEVIAARELLMRYVLTLPEQAREAAKKAEEAKERTDEREASDKDTTKQLAEQQQEAEQAAQETVELLTDKANTADILDRQQREEARDADIAAAQIQQAAQEAQAQMAAAKAAKDDQQRSEALERTEQALEQLANTLEETAEHFEKLDAGEDVAQSRQQLREAEAAMDANQNADLEQRFNEAEAMADAANSDPRELLKKLEEELQRNELMQEELSDISQQAVDNARRTLERAAKDEKSLNQSLERSDQDFQEQKRRAAKQLNELAQRAGNVENAILSTAEQAVGWANDPESRPKVQQAREQLREAAQQVRELGGENALLSDMRDAAKNLSEAIKQADQAVNDVQQQSEKKSQEDIHNSESRRKQTQQSMERAASSLRNRMVQAQNPIRQQWVQAEQEAKRRISQAQSQRRRAEDAQRRAESQLKKDPDNQGLKQQVEQRRQQTEDAEKAIEAAEETREFAEQQRKEVEQRTGELKKQPIPKLNSPNPAAQLAQETAKQAGNELESISKELNELGQDLNFQQQLETTPNDAQALANRQNQITQDVDDAAEQLARAARHEQRLGREPAAEAMQQVAESVDQNAVGATEQAEQSLREAAEDTGRTPEASADVAQATQQIAEEAARLSQMTPGSDPSDQSDAMASQQARPSDAEQQQARQMAETLDELDRSLAAQAQSGQQDQGQPAQQAGNQGQQQDAQQSQPSQSQTAAEASSTLSSMVDAQSQQAARQRMEQMQAAQQGNPSPQPAQNMQSDTPAMGVSQMPAGPELSSEFQPDAIDEDWGKLRQQRPEDASESRANQVAPQYRREVEAYFRAIAKRAKEKAE